MRAEKRSVGRPKLYADECSLENAPIAAFESDIIPTRYPEIWCDIANSSESTPA